jgi:hypothetical protein
MNDLPNFGAWSNENLANFCKDSYIRMQEQQEELQRIKLCLLAIKDLLSDIETAKE